MRGLIIGEAPSRKGDVLPLVKICELVGCSRDELSASYEKVNLFDEWPGKSIGGKGDAFDYAVARDRAKIIAERFVDGRRVILLGKRVALAFGFGNVDYFSNVRLGGTDRVIVVPHPSGINHWWNDPTNRERARQFWIKDMQKLRREL